MMIKQTDTGKYLGLFLKRQGDDIVVCDKNGIVIDNLLSVRVENDATNLTEVTIRVTPCGWFEDK